MNLSKIVELTKHLLVQLNISKLIVSNLTPYYLIKIFAFAMNFCKINGKCGVISISALICKILYILQLQEAFQKIKYLEIFQQ